MIDPDEALRIMAEATASIDASTLRMAANLEALRQGQEEARRVSRLAVRLEAWAIALLGVSILGMGWVLWYSSAQHAQIAQILRLMQQH